MGASSALIPVACVLGLVYLAHCAESTRGGMPGAVRWPSLAGAANLRDGECGRDWVSIAGADPGLVMGIAVRHRHWRSAYPVAFAMIFRPSWPIWRVDLMPPAAVVQNMVNGSTKFLLLAIPFFITAGALMNAGGLTTRLMDFAFKLVGHMRGGFAQVNVVSSGLYAGISGSSYSEAALGTKLLVPQMIKQGYSAPFSCAVTAASATVPNVIPPSIALLILAAASNLSVGSLWIAGVVPGILVMILFH
jgi:TRAP-type mannitol/chloroaromatic compound transport system permease large subunit